MAYIALEPSQNDQNHLVGEAEAKRCTIVGNSRKSMELSALRIALA